MCDSNMCGEYYALCYKHFVGIAKILVFIKRTRFQSIEIFLNLDL